jgi:hypothetical protein
LTNGCRCSYVSFPMERNLNEKSQCRSMLSKGTLAIVRQAREGLGDARQTQGALEPKITRSYLTDILQHKDPKRARSAVILRRAAMRTPFRCMVLIVPLQAALIRLSACRQCRRANVISQPAHQIRPSAPGVRAMSQGSKPGWYLEGLGTRYQQREDREGEMTQFQGPAGRQEMR